MAVIGNGNGNYCRKSPKTETDMKIIMHQPKRKNEMTVYFMIRQNEMKAFINTEVKTTFPIVKSNTPMGYAIDKRETAYRAKMKRLERMYWEITEYIAEHPDMRPSDIRDGMIGKNNKTAKESILAKTIREYAASGKVGESTANIIYRTAKKVEEFDANADFGIDEDWLDKFCAHLANNGTKTNGVALHLRNIRTAFNYARKKKLTKEYPFLDYQIKVEKKPIRNMTIEQLRKFRDFACEPYYIEYRDIFMLMVYLAGVNIGDLMTCKGLVNERLVYSRKKTDRPLSIYVCEEAKKLIEKYKGENWLLSPSDRYKDYHGYMHKMNDGLKKIGDVKIIKDKVGKMRKHEITPVFDGLSTYVARYTWASLAAECGIERDIIAACLGHSWSDVTSHYIAYSQKKMDDAIKRVAEYINEDKK